MRLYRLGILACMAGATGGCQSPETAARAVEPAPIVRVVPQKLPEASGAGSSPDSYSETDVSVRCTIAAAASPDSPTPTSAARPTRGIPGRGLSARQGLAAAEIGRSVRKPRSIRQTQLEEADSQEPGVLADTTDSTVHADVVRIDSEPQRDLHPVPAVAQPDDRYPITLATALHLAGSSNLQVALAQERVREAYARLDGAKVLWVPNISGGVGFNDHAGQLQNIEGEILEVNRQSLFVGGGAGLSNSPLAGGANPPPRMMIDLSPVDVIFEPLAARQRANRASYDASVAFNDTLLEVSYRYLELVRAQAQVTIAREAITNTESLERITADFARTGLGLEADAQRTRAELAERRRELLTSEERVRVTSAELARLLRLDPNVVLFALESQPVPIELISGRVSLDSLIAQGVQARPEVFREYAQIGSTESRIAQERWRPWVPNLHVGVGGGTFGGGRNDNFGDFSGRYDLDALAVWEVRNLGFGNRALVRERESRYRQACIDYQSARDRVGQEVTAAYHQAALRREQIALAEQQIAAAADALPLNFNGIRGRELRPIEAQQAIAALASARNRYVNAVIEYNQAQLALWRAIGHPPDAGVASAASAPPLPAADMSNS